MNDTFKWLLITFAIAIAAFVGGSAVGIDWMQIQVTVLAFLEMLGTLLIFFTGSAAAIEVAKYYRHLNRKAEEYAARSAAPGALPPAEVKAMIQDAIIEALAARDDRAEQQRTGRAEPSSSDQRIDLDIDAPPPTPSRPADRRRERP